MGAPEGDREAGVLHLVALGVAVTGAEVLRGIFQGALGAGQGRPAALHGSYRGALLCHVRLDLAPVHPTRCRWMIKIIKLLWDVIANAKLLGFERLRLEGRELSRKLL